MNIPAAEGQLITESLGGFLHFQSIGKIDQFLLV
jgi:hypothetical protein